MSGIFNPQHFPVLIFEFLALCLLFWCSLYLASNFFCQLHSCIPYKYCIDLSLADENQDWLIEHFSVEMFFNSQFLIFLCKQLIHLVYIEIACKVLTFWQFTTIQWHSITGKLLMCDLILLIRCHGCILYYSESYPRIFCY